MSVAFSVPVLLVGYNRPEWVSRVVEALAAVRPRSIFVVVDGPKDSKPDDPQRCEAVARVVKEGVAWPCDLKLLVRKENLGCARSMSEAITWFFEQVDAGIILEDDTVPAPDFFRMCEDLLRLYRDDERVWCVTGTSFQDGPAHGQPSYYFSKYAECWGWASWRRAWRHYRHDLPDLDEMEQAAWWREVNPDPVEAIFWRRRFEAAASGLVDSWSFRWMCACFQHRGLTATPNVNLVTNIGFGREATHTKDASDKSSNRPAGTLGPLQHPTEVAPSVEADARTYTSRYCPRGCGEERLVWEVLFERQRSLLRQALQQRRGLEKQLRAASKEVEKLTKVLGWAAAHRWKAARKLLTGRWPK